MKMLECPSSDKKNQIERLLSKGTIMIFIDSRKNGVDVPPQHRGNPQLALNLDYSFDLPHFVIESDRVEASLSFNKQRYLCVIPFHAIYTVTSQIEGEAVFFPEDLPMEMALFQKSSTQEVIKKDEPKEPALKVIETEAETKTESSEENKTGETKPDDKKPKTERKKGHLRLVE